jgi:V/A-type H+-transporting ATPase subunit E
MGLQDILEKIRESGNTQVQEIEKSTQSQVNEILAQARMEARQIEEDSRAIASAPAIAERARILHRARLESLRIVGGVREDLVDTAITRTRERLASLPADPSYPEVLRALTEEALNKLDSGETGKAQLLADPRDKALLKNILDNLKLDLPVSYELSCWGGLIAKSEDGRVVVINTLESRLERATAFLRRHLAALFEEEHSTVKDLVHG